MKFLLNIKHYKWGYYKIHEESRGDSENRKNIIFIIGDFTAYLQSFFSLCKRRKLNLSLAFNLFSHFSH